MTNAHRLQVASEQRGRRTSLLAGFSAPSRRQRARKRVRSVACLPSSQSNDCHSDRAAVRSECKYTALVVTAPGSGSNSSTSSNSRAAHGKYTEPRPGPAASEAARASFVRLINCQLRDICKRTAPPANNQPESQPQPQPQPSDCKVAIIFCNLLLFDSYCAVYFTMMLSGHLLL
jgi:hypothetical protein